MKTLLSLSLLLCFGLVVTAQDETCSCCTEGHKAFDFWIGEWSVTNADGTVAGKNTIEKIEDGCILRENWIGSDGKYTGSSINFYNLKTNQWEQLWVDNSGTHLKLKGNRKGNQMILSSDEFTHTDGQKYMNRITWTLNDNGTVRQFWEVLRDKKVIKVAFDGHYTKMK